VLSIMNDGKNKKVFKTTSYKSVKILKNYAKKLIAQRKKLY
jgi:hypothetical protein